MGAVLRTPCGVGRCSAGIASKTLTRSTSRSYLVVMAQPPALTTRTPAAAAVATARTDLRSRARDAVTTGSDYPQPRPVPASAARCRVGVGPAGQRSVATDHAIPSRMSCSEATTPQPGALQHAAQHQGPPGDDVDPAGVHDRAGPRAALVHPEQGAQTPWHLRQRDARAVDGRRVVAGKSERQGRDVVTVPASPTIEAARVSGTTASARSRAASTCASTAATCGVRRRVVVQVALGHPHAADVDAGRGRRVCGCPGRTRWSRRRCPRRGTGPAPPPPDGSDPDRAGERQRRLLVAADHLRRDAHPPAHAGDEHSRLPASRGSHWWPRTRTRRGTEPLDRPRRSGRRRRTYAPARRERARRCGPRPPPAARPPSAGRRRPGCRRRGRRRRRAAGWSWCRSRSPRPGRRSRPLRLVGARHAAARGPPVRQRRERLVAERVHAGPAARAWADEGMQALDPVGHAAGAHRGDLVDASERTSTGQVVRVGPAVGRAQARRRCRAGPASPA